MSEQSHTPSPVMAEKMHSDDPAMSDATMAKAAGVENMQHSREMQDPDVARTDPQNLPLWKKLHATIASFFGVLTLVYAATVATPLVPNIPMVLDTTPTLAKLVFTAPFIGVFFAPLYTPHVTEIFGRKLFYIVSLSLLLIFIGGISAATTVNQLIILRAFAGLVGGPMAVLIEGTHADVWPARKTVSYYCSIALSQYWGAILGPIVATQALAYRGIPFIAYTAIIIGGFAWILVVTMPETYQRKLIKDANKKGAHINLEPPPTGANIASMVNVTVLTPIKMLFTEPLVIMGALLLGLSFAVVFQWFITVPFVLANVYGLDNYNISLVFFGPFVGAAMAFVSSLFIDSVGSRMMTDGGPKIEQRLFSAMCGVLLTTGSLFWIAWTASPEYHYIVPVTGNVVYVWGNMMILLSIVSYFFDAFHPRGILSALTAMACFRLASAAIVPIFILDMFAGLTPPWALSTFGFINLAFIPFPYIMYFFGAKMRARSMYAGMGHGMSPAMMQFEEHGKMAA